MGNIEDNILVTSDNQNISTSKRIIISIMVQDRRYIHNRLRMEIPMIGDNHLGMKKKDLTITLITCTNTIACSHKVDPSHHTDQEIHNNSDHLL